MSQEPAYYKDGEVQITSDTASFPNGSYDIAQVIEAEIWTSETLFLGLDRKTVLPVLGAAIFVLGLIARSVRGPALYLLLLSAWLVVVIMAFKARAWIKDKRRMYNYNVAIRTVDGPIDVYTSADKSTARHIVEAINRAAKDYRKPATELRHQKDRTVALSTGSRTAGRQRANRPDTRPRLKKRHR